MKSFIEFLQPQAPIDPITLGQLKVGGNEWGLG